MKYICKLKKKLKRRTHLLVAVLFLIFICKLAYSALEPGEPCIVNSNCTSNYCREDFAGGKYCAANSTACVHDVNGGGHAEQYADGTCVGSWCCMSGTWKLNEGEPCSSDSDCFSGYCREDFAGGKYCAANSTACVHDVNGGGHAEQYADGGNEGNWYCFAGEWKHCSEGIIGGQCCDQTPLTFTLTSTDTYPGSSIGIDIQKKCNVADTTIITIKLDGTVLRNDCSVSGDPEWGAYMCGVDIPTGTSQGTHTLTMEYTINGKTYTQDVTINVGSVPNVWVSSSCSHGGFISGSVSAGTLDFSKYDYDHENDVYYVPPNATFKIKSLGYTVVTECSNGVSTNTKAGVVAWIYKGLANVGVIDNNIGASGTCDIPGGVEREDLIGSGSETRGFLPSNCNIGWGTFARNSSTSTFKFEEPGVYTIYEDYINAVCDSPDYICPWLGGSWRTNRCKVGLMDTLSEATGWKHLQNITVKVVDPEVKYKSSMGSIEIDDKAEFGGVTGIFEIKFENTGIGKASISSLEFQSLSGLSFNALSLPINIGEGSEGGIDTKADISKELTDWYINVSNYYVYDVKTDLINITFKIDANVTYDDAHSFSTVLPEKKPFNFYYSILRTCDNDFHEKQVINVSDILYHCIEDGTTWFWKANPDVEVKFESGSKEIVIDSEPKFSGVTEQFSLSFKNIGDGRIAVTGITFPSFSYQSIHAVNLPINISQGKTKDVVVNVTVFSNATGRYVSLPVPDYLYEGNNKLKITYNIPATIYYDDAYGYETISSESKPFSFNITITRVCDDTFHPKQIVNISDNLYFCIKDEAGWHWSKNDPCSGNVSDRYCYANPGWTNADVELKIANGWEDCDVDCCVVTDSDIADWQSYTWFVNPHDFFGTPQPQCCNDTVDYWCNATGKSSCVRGRYYTDHCNDYFTNCGEKDVDCGGGGCDACLSTALSQTKVEIPLGQDREILLKIGKRLKEERNITITIGINKGNVKIEDVSGADPDTGSGIFKCGISEFCIQNAKGFSEIQATITLLGAQTGTDTVTIQVCEKGPYGDICDDPKSISVDIVEDVQVTPWIPVTIKIASGINTYAIILAVILALTYFSRCRALRLF